MAARTWPGRHRAGPVVDRPGDAPVVGPAGRRLAVGGAAGLVDGEEFERVVVLERAVAVVASRDGSGVGAAAGGSDVPGDWVAVDCVGMDSVAVDCAAVDCVPAEPVPVDSVACGVPPAHPPLSATTTAPASAPVRTRVSWRAVERFMGPLPPARGVRVRTPDPATGAGAPAAAGTMDRCSTLPAAPPPASTRRWPAA